MISLKITLPEYVALCRAVGVADADRIGRIALASVTHLIGSRAKREETIVDQTLEQRWAASLDAAAPDFGVYATDDYLAELWACWHVYSRGYLAAIQRHSSAGIESILSSLGRVGQVVDLGCGFGATTALLTQLFPTASVVGTNLAGTPQWAIAEQLAMKYGFTLSQEYVGPPADLVLASEYFEHFEDPLAHLADVLAACQPRTLLIANAFTVPAIGHFAWYRHGHRLVTGKAISRAFNDRLRETGYKKIPTTCWNGRPAYWRRRGLTAQTQAALFTQTD